MSCSNEIAVMKNPFSTATIAPKVPDGRVNYSIGCRAQASKDFAFTNNQAILCLQPGLNCMLSAYYHTYTDKQRETKNYWLNSDTMVRWSSIQEKTDTVDKLTLTSPFTAKATDQMPMMWRLISAGARFTFINNKEDDDGWWEAIRVKREIQPQSVRVAFTNIEATTDNDKYKVAWKNYVNVLDAFDLNANDRYDNWPENPTYTTGKLRDIHKHLFYLQTKTNERTFNNLQLTNEVSVTTVGSKFIPMKTWNTEIQSNTDIGTSPSNVDVYHPLVDNEDNAEYTSQCFDNNFDCILIRIKANTGKSDSDSSCRIHIHTISNYEYVWDTDTTMAKFMTDCKSEPGQVVKCDEQIKSTITPTLLRLPEPVKTIKRKRKY